jgi:hypothetical protein
MRTSNRLIYQVREGIRRSASMALAPSDERAGYVLEMVALDTNDAASTAYSFVLTTRASLGKDAGQLILEHQVGLCGSNRVASCADSIVAGTDKAITERVSVLQPLFDEVFALPTSTQADP